MSKTEDTKSIRKAYHPNLVILVVEDHMLFAKEIKHILADHKCILARSLEAGRERYDEHLPHITFLDIDLPDGEGFELLDYILQQEPDAFVIILSGSKMQEDVNKAQRKGARGYIFKPVTRSRVEHYIDEYSANYEKEVKSRLTEIEQNRQNLATNG